MTPGEPLAPTDRARRAAEGWLRLAAAAPPEAARAALLRRLAAEGFDLDPLGHEAALVLAGRPAGPTPRLLAAEAAGADALRDRVEAFAAAFFRLPVAARRAAWGELDRAAREFPRLRARLGELEPGLPIAPAPVADRDPLVGRLAGDLLDLFVAEPSARAALSRAKAWSLYRDAAITGAGRARAIRGLRRRHPAVADLVPGYLDQLARSGKSLRSLRRKARLAAVGESDVGSLLRLGRLATWAEAAVGRHPLARRIARAFAAIVARPIFRLAIALFFPIWVSLGLIAPVDHAPAPGLAPFAYTPIPGRSLARGNFGWVVGSAPLQQHVEGALRRELARVGIAPKDWQVAQAVAGLFPRGGADPAMGEALVGVFMLNVWDEEMTEPGVAAVREGLGRIKVALGPEEVEAVARGTIRGLIRKRPTPIPAAAGPSAPPARPPGPTP